MKQQITENEETLIFGKDAQVSVVTLSRNCSYTNAFWKRSFTAALSWNSSCKKALSQTVQSRWH